MLCLNLFPMVFQWMNEIFTHFTNYKNGCLIMIVNLILNLMDVRIIQKLQFISNQGYTLL